MKKLSNAIDRFCQRHPRFGVPRLMLWVVIASAIIYIFSMMDSSGAFLYYLMFNPRLILQGQIWRLFTFILIPINSSPIWLFISLYFYYFIGSTLERQWGTPKFTIYYLSGILFTALYGLIAGLLSGAHYIYITASYINLSMFFVFATYFPDHQVLVLFIIPVKIKYLAWFDLALTVLMSALYMGSYGFLSFAWLLPIVPIMNYLLFFGRDIRNLLPASMNRRRQSWRAAVRRPNVHWADGYRSKTGERPYRHKCTVCGRTDTDYPNLEFRYCSKCSGYYCYCIDHINNHAHITEENRQNKSNI